MIYASPSLPDPSITVALVLPFRFFPGCCHLDILWSIKLSHFWWQQHHFPQLSLRHIFDSSFTYIFTVSTKKKIYAVIKHEKNLFEQKRDWNLRGADWNGNLNCALKMERNQGCEKAKTTSAASAEALHASGGCWLDQQGSRAPIT